MTRCLPKMPSAGATTKILLACIAAASFSAQARAQTPLPYQSSARPNAALEGLPPTQPVATSNSPSSNTDIDGLCRRLQQAEAEIRDLRTQQKPAAEVVPVDYQAAPTDDGPLAELQEQFAAFKKGYQADKNTLPRFKINAVFQVDDGWFNQDANSRTTFANPLFPGDTTPVQPGGGHIQDGGDFRRARLAASGAVTENMNGFLQMDFAFFGRPTFTDVWGEYTNMPYVGTLRVGQWKHPFSLEVVSSFRYTTFAERSLLF